LEFKRFVTTKPLILRNVKSAKNLYYTTFLAILFTKYLRDFCSIILYKECSRAREDFLYPSFASFFKKIMRLNGLNASFKRRGLSETFKMLLYLPAL